MDALCNTYRCMLCYGATSDAIRAYGDKPVVQQADHRTRAALRRLPAFTRLPADWQDRYAERNRA